MIFSNMLFYILILFFISNLIFSILFTLWKVFIEKPKKSNSARRTLVCVEFINKRFVVCHVPGTWHKLSKSFNIYIFFIKNYWIHFFILICFFITFYSSYINLNICLLFFLYFLFISRSFFHLGIDNYILYNYNDYNNYNHYNHFNYSNHFYYSNSSNSSNDSNNSIINSSDLNNSSNSNNSNNINKNVISTNENEIQISSLGFDMEHYTIGDVLKFSSYSEDEKWNYLFEEYFKLFIKNTNCINNKDDNVKVIHIRESFKYIINYSSNDFFFYEIINYHKNVISANELEFYCFSILHHNSIEKYDFDIKNNFDVKITFVIFSFRKDLPPFFNGDNIIFNYSDLILYNEYYTNYLIKEKEFFLNKTKKHLFFLKTETRHFEFLSE